MFGDGFTHGSPVSSYSMVRCHPAAGTTTRLACNAITSLANRANAPSVMPYRMATGMNQEYADSGSPLRARKGDQDSAFSGFMHVAMSNGMTLGELARLAND